MKWNGVIPAITTPFQKEGQIDFQFLGKHAFWLVENGCSAIVALGSLGEGATLTLQEKKEVLTACVSALNHRAPIVAGVSALSTAEAVRLAATAEELGCSGLMILPPYAYTSDWREMKAHVAAVLRATSLSCMLYNNPVAYGTDFLPAQISELAAEFENFEAVKESSTDVRRVTAIRERVGDRLAVLVGVDDLIVEGVAAGAEGWIAGLVNALPAESVRLFELARHQRWEKAFELYYWFLPLLRLDTDPKLVQLIKLVQAEVEMGFPYVRAPRLQLEGAERERALGIIRTCLEKRPLLNR